ncbi:hypothetical protein ABH935_006399 [Catenulispora sp. GAS73]|uniref:hypothetical protein n=1 Tax=Catenulispora sp. GAS73 TaxID=3156269 RepID=UPI00351547FC
MSSSDERPPRRGLAEKIELVLQATTPVGQQPPSNDEIAKRMNARAELMYREGRLPELLSVTKQWSWQLRRQRNGKWPDTLFQNLVVFAEEFGTPISFFADGPDALRIEKQLEELSALKQDANVVAVAHRMSNLSPERQALVMAALTLAEGETSHAED